MQCKKCGTDNLRGHLYCQNCDAKLYEPTPLSDESQQAWLDTVIDDTPYGFFDDGTSYWLIIQPQLFYKKRQRLIDGQLVVGRIPPTKDHTIMPLNIPEIDELGVSRIHASLHPLENTVGIQDNDSTNGTRLNGQRLNIGRLYHLSHNDELEIGQLCLHVHFAEMSPMLHAARENLTKQFHPQVRDALQGVVFPIEALKVLSLRLPNQTGEQFQVVTFFKEKREAVTLDRLHNTINKVLGAGTGETRQLMGSKRHSDTVSIDELDIENATRQTIVKPLKSLQDVVNAQTTITDEWLNDFNTDLHTIRDMLNERIKEARHSFTPDHQRQQVVTLAETLLETLNTFNIDEIKASKAEDNHANDS